MAKSDYLPRLLYAAVICICIYAGGGCLRNKEQGTRSKDRIVEHLPKTHTLSNPTHEAAQNDALLGRIRSVYSAEIGIRESTGNNDGKRIEEYLAYVGLGKGNPWCAAFVCWVYGQAGVDNPGTGWSPALFPKKRIIWARSRRMGKAFRDLRSVISGSGNRAATSVNSINRLPLNIKNSSGTSANSIQHSNFNIQNSPRPRGADVFGIWFQEKRRIAHCGFIDEWGEKYLITVEGNTNESGSREGDGVYRKRRLTNTIYQVARWARGVS